MLIIFWSTSLLLTPSLTQVPFNHLQAITTLFFSGWLAHILFIYLALFVSFLLFLKTTLKLNLFCFRLPLMSIIHHLHTLHFGQFRT